MVDGLSATDLVADPLPTTPPRRPPSARRTSHIDMIPTPLGLRLAGAARDLVTTEAGGVVAGAAAVTADLDAGHRLVSVETAPPDERAAGLVGRLVGRGFRGAVDDAFATDEDLASPLYLLLDDLPVAALISGYARLYSGEVGGEASDASLIKADICSGWRSDGTMVVSLRTKGLMPVPIGPTPTDLIPAGDPLAWHDIEPLPPAAMRRRRLVEVTAGDPLRVFAMFRDTHVDAGGSETVLHEYTVTASLDPQSLVLSNCEAEPRVLPWSECPAAAASAHRLDGHRVDELRDLVRAEFRGTTTCTHLNDLFRSLADLGPLTRLITR